MGIVLRLVILLLEIDFLRNYSKRLGDLRGNFLSVNGFNIRTVFCLNPVAFMLFSGASGSSAHLTSKLKPYNTLLCLNIPAGFLAHNQDLSKLQPYDNYINLLIEVRHNVYR